MSHEDARGQHASEIAAVHAIDRATDRLAGVASPRALFALVVTAIVVGAGRRILVGWDAPLWLDESFTGAVAIRPTYRGVIENSLKDAPVARDMDLAQNDSRWTCKRFGGPAAAHYSDAVVTACYRLDHG